MRYPIADSLTFFVEDSKTFPEKDFNTKEVITNDKGEMKFKLKLMAEENGRLEHFEFIYWGAENPLENIPAMSPVTVRNVELGVGTYRNREGRTLKWWNFYCSAVDAAKKG